MTKFKTLLLLTATLLLWNCKESTTQSEEEPNKEIDIESLILSDTEIELNIDESKTLGVEINPHNATDKSIKWFSNDNTVATVDNLGKVTAIKEGETTITVQSTQKPEIANQCRVIVLPKDPLKETNPYLEVSSVTYASIIVDTKCNGYDGNFFLGTYPTNDFINEFAEDKELLAYYLLELNASFQAVGMGSDLAVADNLFVFNSDTQTNLGNVWSIQHCTSYTLLAFGVEPDGSITTDIFMTEATTAELPEGEVKISQAGSYANDIVIRAEPSDNLNIYLTMACTKEDFEGFFEGNPDFLALALLADMRAKLYDLTVADDVLTFSGVHEEICLNKIIHIEQNTDYVVFAFGIDANCKQCTEVTILNVLTDAFPAPQGELESITVSNVSYNSADVTIDAGDYDWNYYFMPCPKEDFENKYDSDPTKMAEAALEIAIDNSFDFITPNLSNLFRGDNTIQLKYTNWVIKEDTEYYAVAFGVNYLGELSSEVIMSDVFKTQKINDFSIAISVTSVGSDNIMFNLKPSEEGVDYFYDIFTASEIEGLSDQEIIEISESRYSPYMFMYIFNTEKNIFRNELTPNTDYVIISCGYTEGVGMTSDMTKAEFTTIQ